MLCCNELTYKELYLLLTDILSSGIISLPVYFTALGFILSSPTFTAYYLISNDSSSFLQKCFLVNLSYVPVTEYKVIT